MKTYKATMTIGKKIVDEVQLPEPSMELAVDVLVDRAVAKGVDYTTADFHVEGYEQTLNMPRNNR